MSSAVLPAATRGWASLQQPCRVDRQSGSSQFARKQESPSVFGVELDVREALYVRREFHPWDIEGSDTLTTQRAEEVTELKDDILACSWTAGVAQIVSCQ